MPTKLYVVAKYLIKRVWHALLGAPGGTKTTHHDINFLKWSIKPTFSGVRFHCIDEFPSPGVHQIFQWGYITSSFSLPLLTMTIANTPTLLSKSLALLAGFVSIPMLTAIAKNLTRQFLHF